MDPLKNPYAPGAGTPPPELAGRDDLIERAAVALDRIRAGRAARSLILHGLRGCREDGSSESDRNRRRGEGFREGTSRGPGGEIAASDSNTGPARGPAASRSRRRIRANFEKAGRALAGFARALRVKYKDIEVATDFEPERGLADSGDLDTDLTDLMAAVGSAAQEYRTAVVLFIDELQYLREDQFASLIRALHGSSQRQLPITMLTAGLPQLIGQMGRANSYAERLFEFVPIDRLDDKAASAALRVPAQREGVALAQEAITEILRHTMGYPYFLQEWGRHAWNVADSSPISRTDSRRATALALAQLDAGFFRVRFDRLTATEKHYLRAMAELGSGPHR
jgi:hypothetical protein